MNLSPNTQNSGCACAGNAGNVFPATDFKGNRRIAIPSCITARRSRTCRDAYRDRQTAVAGKTFSAFPAHVQPPIIHWKANGKQISCVHHFSPTIFFNGKRLAELSINNRIHKKLWDVISQPCLNLNSDLTKSTLCPMHGSLIIFHRTQ